ncbi:MAG: dihydropyrimidinase [Gemmatimonadaceae bacterium]
MTYSYDLVIRGGTVVTAAETVSCEIGIRDGIITALGRDLGNAREVLDATGRLVLPGGVDAHCHIDQKSSTGLITADDFYTGGVSAACGGTTTIIPFAAQHRGNSLVQVVRDYEAKAAPRAFVDYAFHLIVSDATPTVLQQELPQLIHEGHPSLKVYLTYDALRLTDKDVLAVLQVARREGAITMFHAEHHESIAWHIERLLAEGKTAPKWHPYARPEAAEREATGRACYLAEVTGAPILIVHVSAGSPLDEIRRARARGVHVLAETCPQYLVFTREDLDRSGFEGAKLMFSPPARDRAAQEALWEGLADGSIDIFSSDHAPYRYDDPQGKKAHGEDAPFTKIPNGVPSLELRLPLLFSEGVKKGRLSLERFVALTATNPARTYGLLPRKGTIAVGSDADVVLWDPDRMHVVSHALLHDRMDYTPFEGMQLTGWPVTTLSRGEVIWHEGEVRGAAGRGRLIHRPAQRMAT